MSASGRRVPWAAPLIHWLAIVGGLGVLTVLRFDEPDKTVPVWVGAVVGTALGQVMARARLRLWLAAFLMTNAFWLGPLLAVTVWQIADFPGMKVVFTTLCFLSFVSGTLCGYLSLTERGALFACWFPTVLWMVSILDGSTGASLGAAGWILPTLLVGLLLAFLAAHEARRISIWRTHGAVPRGSAVEPAFRRVEPLRGIGRGAWMTAVVASTLAMAAWIAPHLWQREDCEGAGAGVGEVPRLAADGRPCCPTVEAESSQRRVEEYLSLPRAAAEATPSDVACTPCVGGRTGAVAAVAGGTTAWGAPAGAGDATSAVDEPAAPATHGGEGPATQPVAAPARSSHVAPVAHDSPTWEPSAAGTTTIASQPPAEPASTAAVGAAPPLGPRSDAPSRAAPSRTTPARAAPSHPSKPFPSSSTARASADGDGPSIAWMATLIAVGAALGLALRPVRRLLTIRHLRLPLWRETVDQRVSNLWHMVLVGLRDAGWRSLPGEQPHALARRVGLDGVATCAAVLERARHGVRVDAYDMVQMERAARLAYRSARRRAGFAARAVAWLRWPLT